MVLADIILRWVGKVREEEACIKQIIDRLRDQKASDVLVLTLMSHCFKARRPKAKQERGADDVRRA